MQKPVGSETASNQFLSGGGKLNQLIRSSDWATPAVFDDLPFSVSVLMGSDLVIEFANKFTIDLWQRPKAELLGRKLFDVFPETRTGVEHIHQNVYRTGERCIAKELRVMLRGNNQLEERWFSSVVDPLRSDSGTVIGQLVTTIEITDQVRARKIVENHERRLQRLFSHAPAAIAVVQCPELRYVMANEGYQKLFGRTAHDLLGRTVREVFPEIEGQGIYEMLEAVSATGEPFTAKEFHASFIKDADRNFQGYYDFVAEPIKSEDGNVESIMIHVVDVTDRVEARIKVEQTNEFLEIAMEVAELGTYDYHPKAGTFLWSAKTQELFGVEQGSTISYETYLQGLHPDDRDRTHDAVQLALSSGGLYKNEYRTVGITNGKIRWVSSQGKVFSDRSGKGVRFIGVTRDITKTKISEAILRGQKEALEQAFNGKPISEVLDRIVRTIELQGTQKLFASILIANIAGTHLLFGAAPSLPPEYNAACKGIEIGPAAGSCGTAAFTKSPVVVEDIATDPLWNDYRAFALPHGLRACWSSPIISSKGNVLGTFAIYYTNCQRPSEEEREIVNLLSTTVGIIIEWYQGIVLGHEREVAIHETEKRFRDLIEQATVATAVLEGKDMRLTVANDVMLNIWQRDKSIIGKNLLDFMPELADQPFPSLLREVYETGITHIEENALVILNRNGRLEDVYMDYSYKALRKADGQPYGVLVSAADVTERFASQRKVELSEQRFQNLVREATVGIVVLVGKEMRVEIANEAYARLVGLTPDDLLGKRLFSVIPQAEEFYRPILESVLDTGAPVILHDSPYSVITNGKKVEGFVHVVNQPYRDSSGKILGVMEIAQDVTESVLSRKSLEESEERFRTLATNIPQIVWTSDPSGKVDYLSKQWEEHTGQSIEEGTLSTHEVIHPEDNAKVLQWWNESKNSGRGLRMDYRLKNIKTGEYRWFSVVVHAVKDKDGRIFKWIGTASDIHEKKQSAEKLEQLVAERTRELTQSNEDLQQFAHVASHDLKEPVRKIKTFGNRFLEEMQDRLDDRGRMYLTKILKATDRMTSMIDGVLTYSTLNASLLQPKPVDLNTVIENIKTDLELIISQTKTLVRTNNLPLIEGAEVLLYQLFYNLISNSIKFRAADVSPVIEISSIHNPDNKSCTITIEDNGIGFDPRFSDSIFDIFTRLNPKDQFEGTGLGLALCKKIIERHEGTIKASSAHNRGSIFIIGLPLKQSKHHI